MRDNGAGELGERRQMTEDGGPSEEARPASRTLKVRKWGSCLHWILAGPRFASPGNPEDLVDRCEGLLLFQSSD